MIISYFPPADAQFTTIPQFTYTGNYRIEAEEKGWKIKFLTSGTLIFFSNVNVDIFAVGAGGRGYPDLDGYTDESMVVTEYGGGGGGGYTNTVTNVPLTADTEYAVTIGGATYEGGEASSFSDLCTANGGGKGYSNQGGDGGSGGAANGHLAYTTGGMYEGGQRKISGGQDGSDGYLGMGIGVAGTGQGTTTREFGEAGGTLYATGGDALSPMENKPNPAANTGNGGNSGSQSYFAASGIIVIRNTRS